MDLWTRINYFPMVEKKVLEAYLFI